MSSSDGLAQKVVPHTAFTGACRDLERALLSSRPGSVIFLVGVSGAGKTWVRHTVARRLFGDPSKWPRGKVPYVEVMSLLADRGYFSPKDLALSLYGQINAPNVNWLYRDPDRDSSPYALFERQIAQFEIAWSRERRPKSEREAWRDAIACGRARGVKVFSIEHASLMAQNRVNGTAVQHTLNLMSLATDMGSSVLLTTTPEGFCLWSKYAEINTRSTHIYINPYRAGCANELRNFATLVKHLAADVRFKPKDLPLSVLIPLVHATQTAPAGVRNIFLRAENLASLQGKEFIDLKTLIASFPSKRDVENIQESASILQEQQAPFEHSSFEQAGKTGS